MKTIKTLLKELLARGQSRDERPVRPKKGTENNQTNLNQNQNQNETETNQDPGDNRVADTDPPKVDRNDQEESPESEPAEQGQSGESERYGKPDRDRDRDRELEEAFQRGVIEGRNQQIMEKYFPKTDDGLPHFHGSPSKGNTTPDIFSMAREA